MTEHKDRKAEIRQRMARAGEPYSVARRAIEASTLPGDLPNASELAGACGVCGADIADTDRYTVMRCLTEHHGPEGTEIAYGTGSGEPWEQELPPWGDGYLLICQTCALGDKEAIRHRHEDAVARAAQREEATAVLPEISDEALAG